MPQPRRIEVRLMMIMLVDINALIWSLGEVVGEYERRWSENPKSVHFHRGREGPDATTVH